MLSEVLSEMLKLEKSWKNRKKVFFEGRFLALSHRRSAREHDKDEESCFDEQSLA
jgi:hypothetical protein